MHWQQEQLAAQNEVQETAFLVESVGEKWILVFEIGVYQVEFDQVGAAEELARDSFQQIILLLREPREVRRENVSARLDTKTMSVGWLCFCSLRDGRLLNFVSFAVR
eukprot:3528031-Rhodomonas_salina.3